MWDHTRTFKEQFIIGKQKTILKDTNEIKNYCIYTFL